MKLNHRIKLMMGAACCLFLLLWGMTPAARAQGLTATLNGAVTDTSGAVIPNANVVIALNGVGGASRTVQTDDSGYYAATNLAAGNYTVSVRVAGFAPYTAKDVVLNVAQKRSLSIQLNAGAVTTNVVVEGNPVTIDVDSSSQAGTITGVQVRELEISNRNFENLVTLQPGVVNAGMGDEAAMGNTGLAVNGARPSANNWTVDGADVNDSGSNQTVVNAPSIDAIQEFTLQRGTYDAGYGRSGGGQILVQTKSGTSSFHGDAYEFVRNTDFNANEWFNKRNGGARPDYHRNDFGYTIGGPFFIPHHYNANKSKTFFFWSQEWQRMITPSSTPVAAADANEVAGLISEAAIKDANGKPTGSYQPYVPTASTSCAIVTNNSNATITSGGVSIPAYTDYIPSTCWSQNSAVYNKRVFGPYIANAGSEYEYTVSGAEDPRQEIARVDHYFNDKLRLFVRGMHDSIPYDAIGGMWQGSMPPGLGDLHVNTPGYNVVANLTWTISPRMINELELVFAQGNYKATPFGGQFFDDSSVGLTDNWPFTDPYGRNPWVSVANVVSYPGAYGPYKERNLDRTIFDNFTYTMGRHTLRAGFQFQQMLKTENATGGNASFGFQNSISGTATGGTYSAPVDWSYGDFLLGQIFTFSQASQDVIPDLRYLNSEVYVQDDWKINSKLTINLGVRWSRFPGPSDANHMLVNFDPTVFSANQAATIDATGANAGNFNASSAILPATYANGLIFPKGAACAAAQKINATQATCSPYGAEVNPNYNTNFAPRVGFAYNPDGHGQTSIRGGFGLFYDRSQNGMWEYDAFDNPGLVTHVAYDSGSFDSIMGGTSAPPSLTPNFLYATGTPALKVPFYVSYNLSVQRQLLPTTIVEVAYVGNAARHLLGQYDENQPTLAARQNNTAANVNYLRPYAGFGDIDVAASVFTNNYNSLQVSASHRAHGLTLAVAYTWSKDLTTNSNDRGAPGASNTYDLKLDYGPSESNMPQVLEFNYVYDLPFYARQHGLLGHVIGGWEISGITSFLSGTSTTVTQTLDPFLDSTGTNGGVGLTAPHDRAAPSIRPNQSRPVSLTKHVDQWFDPSVFSAASGAWGTEKNGAFLGPGAQRWDFAAIKNVKLGEYLKFQLRGEFFNIFNHESFGAFTGNDSAPMPIDEVLGTPSFGQVTGGHDPRIIQIAGKLTF